MANDADLLAHLIELEKLRAEGWFKHDKDILSINNSNLNRD